MSSRRKPSSSISIINILSKSAIFGESSKSFFKVSHPTLKDIEVFKATELSTFFYTAKILEENLSLWNPSKDDVLQTFSDLKQQLEEVQRRDFDTDKPCKKADLAKWARDITLEHIVTILQQFIASFTLLPLTTAWKQEKEDVLEMKGIALEILHIILVDYENCVYQCSENDSFLHSLFSYMQYDQTCFPACHILECVILSKKCVFDLTKIELLTDIITRLNDVHLGNFCKILALTLSELDIYENKTSLYAQTKQVQNKNFFVRDKNQDAILRIPNILSRLVNIACARPYVPWFPSGFIEREQWLRWIQAMSLDSSNVPESFVGGITQWSSLASHGPEKTSIKVTLELTFRADAVCVLGLLLVGRHRKEVQKELADLRLIPQLSDLFDHFIWRTNAREYTRLPGHNSSCECSPEVALKIQVLRLIHSFCDHSDYKQAMLSWSEYSEILAMEEMSEPESLTRLNRDTMCVGIKGLLSKIVEVIKKETGASTFRFWLSRAIESYLRGSFSSADQDFLLRRDLLRHVVQNLIASNIRHKEVLQSSFDLLGELVKFNISAFVDFKSLVYHSNARQRKLLSLMNSSLVDSNMFIRSLILSYEHFVSSGDGNLKAFAEEGCHVLQHVGSVKTRVQYLQKLLSLINIHNLTLENVSCLNTALVILMFGFKKKELHRYLQTLATNLEGCSAVTNSCSAHLDNLKDLLLFWQDHYLQKDKDCTILEKSSRIPFQEWKDTVSLLVSDDHEDPCSIAFYTVQPVAFRAS